MAAPTKRIRRDEGEGDEPLALHLTVMGPEHYTTHHLPRAGTVLVGRDEGSDVRLTDPDASRKHARLHIGDDRIEIEDLASSNGTLVREKRITVGDRVPILPGEAISIGHTTLMVQRRRPVLKVRRLWPHGYFEGRLEEACDRAIETGAKLAVLRIQVGREGRAAGIGDLISRALRSGDVLAQFGPDDYEVLLIDTEPPTATAVAKQVEQVLASESISAKVLVVFCPTDGRSAQELIARASAVLHGPVRRSDSEPVLESEAMRRVYLMAQRAAKASINVLVLGETGVGKEVLSESIHRMSGRSSGPFVCINCGALTETLLESELFGHEKGAFTGATQTKEGLLETASGGTVFLDEIGEMPLGLQTRLLRVIETREITRVGGLKPRPVNVRFIAATHRDLEQEIEKKTFRQDLYYRLNGISLTIPPLRERTGEILPLARSFLQTFAGPMMRKPPEVSGEAASLLTSYLWPGNIRELRNVMERALLLCDGDALMPEHLPVEKMRVAFTEQGTPAAARATPAHTMLPPPNGSPPSFSQSKDWKQEVDRQRVVDALNRCAGNQTKAAAMMGISRRAFCERLKKYQIPRPRV